MYGRIKKFVDMVRPYNALPIFLAVLISFFATNNSVATGQLIIGLVIVAMLHSYATLANDVLDSDIDIANNRESILLRGGVTKQQLQTVNLWLVIFSFVGIASLRNYAVVIISIVAVGLSWAYNYRPLRLSFRPLGSMVTLGLLYGFLPFLFGGYIASTKPSSVIFVLAVIWFLQRCGVSLLKDYKDKSGDKKFGKNTFLIAYGEKATAYVTITLAIIANILLATYMFMHSQNSEQYIVYAIVCAGMLIAIWVRSRLLFAPDNKGRIVIAKKAFVLQNVLDIGVLLWFII